MNVLTSITVLGFLIFFHEMGHFLGWVNSHIILGLVFICVVQPIAFIMRFTGYDPLKRRRKGEKTYRENRQNHRTDLTRIF